MWRAVPLFSRSLIAEKNVPALRNQKFALRIQLYRVTQSARQSAARVVPKADLKPRKGQARQEGRRHTQSGDFSGVQRKKTTGCGRNQR
jgi:hypothetical protein